MHGGAGLPAEPSVSSKVLAAQVAGTESSVFMTIRSGEERTGAVGGKLRDGSIAL